MAAVRDERQGPIKKPIRRTRLALGVACWALAVAMTRHEVAAARAKHPIDARTMATLFLYLCAALLVLSGVSGEERTRT